MDEVFGAQFKKILILEVVAAFMLGIHLVVYQFIATQGGYLQNYAEELLPNYSETLFRWVMFEIFDIVITMIQACSMKADNRLKSSDTSIYLLIGVMNIIVAIIAISEASNLAIFLLIAIDYAFLKTTLAIVTYVVSIFIMLTVVIFVVITLVKVHRKPRKI